MLKNKGFSPDMRVRGMFPFSGGKKLRLPISYLWNKVCQSYREGDVNIELREGTIENPSSFRVHHEQWQIDSSAHPKILTRIKRIGKSQSDSHIIVKLANNRKLVVSPTFEFITRGVKLKKAKNLSIGDEVQLTSGKYIEVTDVIIKDGERCVFYWIETNTTTLNVEGVRTQFREG